VRVILAEGLEAEIEAMDSWWRGHRSKAPELFVEELAGALDAIKSQPNGFPVYREVSRGIVRRAPMPKTRNHVYYVKTEEVIIIVSVWGSPRERGPDLG
jgi:hypothetical protein